MLSRPLTENEYPVKVHLLLHLCSPQRQFLTMILRQLRSVAGTDLESTRMREASEKIPDLQALIESCQKPAHEQHSHSEVLALV